MTTVTVYRSTDTGAPTLTGQAGSLCTVLDAVLVNGYNSNNPAGAGWTIAYTATSKRAYRMSAVDGTGFYLSVDDTGTGNSAKEAFMCGFETMSAIATGTGQFPTSAQLNLNASSSPVGGVVVRKSTSLDGVARIWTIIADDTCFYMFTETGDNGSIGVTYAFFFGDIFSYKPSDAYRCLIVGRNVMNNNQAYGDPFGAQLSFSTTFLNNTIAGMFMARSWTAAGTSIPVGHHWDQTKIVAATGAAAGGTSGTGLQNNSGNNQSAMGRLVTGSSPMNPFVYPNGPDGGLYMSPVWIHHGNAVRGYMKGLWAPLHDKPLGHNDTFSGTGVMSGKTFLAQMIWLCAFANDVGQTYIETSSTWS